ncbi:MAG: iron ABC transporter substrate-binding protein [Actinobacteria bacterium]|nr:iron ABC transporter substrate-binding protein [Actinomycetota bacterium]
MRHARRTIASLIVLLVAVTASGCGGGADELVIYSGRGRSLVGPLLDQFAEETGIPIAVRYGDSGELALLIAEEGADSPADVFLSQSPGAVGFLAGRDLLAPLDEDLLGRVDERFRAGDGTWVGVTGRQRVVVYNQDLVDPDELPSSVFELTEPPYEGRIAVAPQNASFQDFVTAMRLEYGDDRTLKWLEGMAANGARVYPNNNAIVDAVSRGEAELGLVNHYYNFRFLEEDPDLPSRNHVLPDGDIGALLITSSVSILASSDDGERGDRFASFLLSEEAQRYFSDETFEYPLAAGVEPSQELPPLGSLEVPDVDVDALSDLATTTDLIAQSGLSG